MSDALDGVKPILNHYDLAPTTISQYGRALKVTTGRGTYALKTLSFQIEARFLDTVNSLHSHGFPMLPIFLTKYGEPLVRMNNQCYYLSPWVEDLSRNVNRKWEIMIDRLAWLHRRTKQPVSQNVKHERAKVENHYRWEESQMALERFIFQAEHKTYPSPFEQRIFLLFHRIMSDAEHAKSIVGSLQKSEDKESQERVVLCHGKPSIDHIVLSEKGPYFINFEHAYWGSPVHELAHVFQSSEAKPDYLLRFYTQYQGVNSLTVNEKKLLMAELMRPDPFEHLMKNYRETSRKSELSFIEQLHELCERRQHLQLLFHQLETEISDETNPPLDPPLEETNIESNEQNENNNVEGRGPENGSDHLENGEG
jgi:spore coat protein YsxE